MILDLFPRRFLQWTAGCVTVGGLICMVTACFIGPGNAVAGGSLVLLSMVLCVPGLFLLIGVPSYGWGYVSAAAQRRQAKRRRRRETRRARYRAYRALKETPSSDVDLRDAALVEGWHGQGEGKDEPRGRSDSLVHKGGVAHNPAVRDVWLAGPINAPYLANRHRDPIVRPPSDGELEP